LQAEPLRKADDLQRLVEFAEHLEEAQLILIAIYLSQFQLLLNILENLSSFLLLFKRNMGGSDENFSFIIEIGLFLTI
jgi:hypothetical protein